MSISWVLASITTIIVFVTSGLAGHLSSNRPWHKKIFWGGGLIAAVLVIVQAWINSKSSADLQGKIERIEQVTKSNLHTNIDILSPLPVTGDPYFPFRIGTAPNVAVMYRNTGEHAATQPFLGLDVVVAPNPLDDDKASRIWKDSDLHRHMAGGETLTPRSEGRFLTAAAPPLTDMQITGLYGGTLQLCVLARVIWKDETGAYSRSSFTCFQRQPSTTAGQAFFTWRSQGIDFNKEERISYEMRMR